MSKRKEPEGEHAPAAPGAPPPPPRLGDHSSYMPEPLLPLADVHIKVKEGSTLPAHTLKLAETCGALARSSELFAGASAERPVALSSPFDEYAEADVARFLKCIYTATGNALSAEDATLPTVVRLAHALDAAPVLAAARRRLVEQVRTNARASEIVEAAKLAALCSWEDVRTESAAALVDRLQQPLGEADTPVQQALSDVDAFWFARALIELCPPELAARAVGTLAANFRWLRAAAPAAARDSALSPAEAAVAALAAADNAAIEVDGRFAAALDVPAFSDDRPDDGSAFNSLGLDWELVLMANGEMGAADGRPRLGLELRGGWPKKVGSAASSIDKRNTNPNQPTNQPRPSRLVSNSLEGALPAWAHKFGNGAVAGEPRR